MITYSPCLNLKQNKVLSTGNRDTPIVVCERAHCLWDPSTSLVGAKKTQKMILHSYRMPLWRAGRRSGGSWADTGMDWAASWDSLESRSQGGHCRIGTGTRSSASRALTGCWSQHPGAPHRNKKIAPGEGLNADHAASALRTRTTPGARLWTPSTWRPAGRGRIGRTSLRLHTSTAWNRAIDRGAHERIGPKIHHHLARWEAKGVSATRAKRTQTVATCVRHANAPGGRARAKRIR
jgi:hypothetical protein